MATKDNASALLSKVAKFVRNPTTNWEDLDKPVPEAESGYSKQALKEMIERKRRNDFVRKREFDQLRKLRNRDPSVPIDPAEQAGRPSFYQSSMPSNLDERAHTLKKIDEIEAQMSKQWWKGKPGEPAATETPTNLPTDVGTMPRATNVPSSLAEDAEFLSTRPSAEVPMLEGKSDFEKTQIGGRLGTDSGSSAGSKQPVPGKKPGQSVGAGASSSQDGSGFSTSKLFAVELSDEATDPELEEAAIRFANGDNAGAEEGLRDALERTKGQSEYAEFWIAALFDLYRATDQQAKFDALALDFAAQLGRSAPAWHSMKDALAGNEEEEVHTAPQDLRGKAIWHAPALLDLSGMGELRLALANAQMPWFLDWTGLKEVQQDALKMLGSLFAQWCVQEVRLRFEGAVHLESVLAKYTPSGDKTTHQSWWRLRMDALRVMRMQDEFELVALDYCVTFEVSPPSWQDPVSEYLHDGVSVASQPLADSVHFGDEESDPDRGSSAATALVGLDGLPPVVVALEGEILGDAAAVLQKLEEGRHQGQGRLVVSCARLIRVDFSAAGSILNWVANRQEEGFSVQFRDVHRLVGAFFNVIGINEHAKVVLRAN